jgi:hypothetical protein
VEDLDARGVLEGESEGLFVAVYLQEVLVRLVVKGRGKGGKEKKVGYIRTEKKYALSPAPSLPESGRYLAYGGPHCRVSSPLVGCSIFITSALNVVSSWVVGWRKGGVECTLDRRGFACSMADMN